MSYELTFPPAFTGRSPQTGRFLKGHVPANKGRKWCEYMGKRAQRRAAKGWKNLDVHRPRRRADNAGRCRKKVIAVCDDGSWCMIPDIGAASQWCGGRRENVRRCCQQNHDARPLKKSAGHQPGYVNTDHRYLGIRFYYENDNIWTTKIK